MQFVVLCFAGLLWYSKPGWMREFIPLGLFALGFDAVVDMIVQFFDYPFFHWVQVTEWLLSGVILLIIPTLGFLTFNYLGKLQHHEYFLISAIRSIYGKLW
jgi:hypothetical protein